MPLFVVPAKGVAFDDTLKEQDQRLRSAKNVSARFIPNEINRRLAEVPRTIVAAKSLRFPVKKLVAWAGSGKKVVNKDSMANAGQL